MAEVSIIFVDKHAISRVLGIRPGTLKIWRLGRSSPRVAPRLNEGAHWVRMGERSILYNLPLLTDFVATRHNPEAHKIAISAYLASLPSSKAGRKSAQKQTP
jgi:hypothetical protein